MSAAALPRVTAPERHDILSWITTTDHKRIGVLYMGRRCCSCWSRDCSRWRSARSSRVRRDADRRPRVQPDIHAARDGDDLSGDRAVRAGAGQLPDPAADRRADMAFPRLNATSYWMFLSAADHLRRRGDERRRRRGRLDLVRSALGDHDLDRTGPGFLDRRPGNGVGRVDRHRAQLRDDRLHLPRAGDDHVAAADLHLGDDRDGALIFMAFPSLTATLLMLFVDRRLGGHVFDRRTRQPDLVPAPVLVLRPPRSVRADPAVLRRDQRGDLDVLGRPMFGYTGMVLAAFAIAGLSMGVWAHHMSPPAR